MKYNTSETRYLFVIDRTKLIKNDNERANSPFEYCWRLTYFGTYGRSLHIARIKLKASRVNSDSTITPSVRRYII